MESRRRRRALREGEKIRWRKQERETESYIESTAEEVREA